VLGELWTVIIGIGPKSHKQTLPEPTSRVGNRPGRPTGAYGLACLSLAWPDLFMKKVRLRLLKKPI